MVEVRTVYSHHIDVDHEWPGICTKRNLVTKIDIDCEVSCKVPNDGCTDATGIDYVFYPS